jgi:sugar phosphate isomerase/epimerase
MDGALGRGLGAAQSVFLIAREAGLDGVECCLRTGYEDDALWTLDGARRVRDAAADAGLDLPSLSLLILNQGGFAGDGATRERARSVVRHGIDVAHALGARTILLPFFGAGKIAGDAALGQVVEDLSGLAPAAAAAGVRLGIESTLPAATVLGAVRQIGSPAVTVYFDVANAVWLGYDPVAEIETLAAAGELPQIHVKDIVESPGDAAPGEGRVPYPDVAAALTRAGYDGYLVFETRPTDEPAAAARRHKAYMEGLLPSHG